MESILDARVALDQILEFTLEKAVCNFVYQTDVAHFYIFSLKNNVWLDRLQLHRALFPFLNKYLFLVYIL